MPLARLPIEKLTAEAFAPFGDVITTHKRSWFPINDGTTRRYHDLATIDVDSAGGRPLLSIFRVSALPHPINIERMERHPLGSQAFMPLGREAFLVVVADRGEFRPASLRAFLTDGRQGVNYHRDVWHHAIIALNHETDFLVIDRGGAGRNCDEIVLSADPPVWVDLSAH